MLLLHVNLLQDHLGELGVVDLAVLEEVQNYFAGPDNACMSMRAYVKAESRSLIINAMRFYTKLSGETRQEGEQNI